MAQIQQYASGEGGIESNKPILLDKQMFRECIKDNIVLIRRALTGDFVIPEFSKFCAVVDDIYWACRTHSDGKVDYHCVVHSCFIISIFEQF